MKPLTREYNQAVVEDALKELDQRVTKIFDQVNFHQDNTQPITASAGVGQRTNWVQADATSAAITVTLPPVTQRRTVVVSKVDTSSNSVITDTPDSSLINSFTSVTIVGGNYATLVFASDGNEWVII